MRVGEGTVIDPSVRFFNAEYIHIGRNVRIDAFCILVGPVEIGDNVHIAAYCAKYGQAPLVMCDFSGLSSRVAIYTSGDDYSGEWLTSSQAPPELRNVTHAPVLLKEGALVGTNCTLLPGVVIGLGAAVGAHTLVRKSVADHTIVTGAGEAKFLRVRKRRMMELIQQSKERPHE